MLVKSKSLHLNSTLISLHSNNIRIHDQTRLAVWRWRLLWYDFDHCGRLLEHCQTLVLTLSRHWGQAGFRLDWGLIAVGWEIYDHSWPFLFGKLAQRVWLDYCLLVPTLMLEYGGAPLHAVVIIVIRAVMYRILLFAHSLQWTLRCLALRCPVALNQRCVTSTLA